VDAVIDCFASAGNIRKAYQELENLVKKGIGEQEDQFNKKTLKNWLLNNFQNQGTIADAYSVVRNGGHVEVIGSRGDHLLRPTGKFMETEVTSCGPWGGTPQDAETVLQLINDEKITSAQLNLLLGCEQPFTSKGFSEGVDALRKSQVMGRIFFKM
jgi:threonine dehydrogenase-like Zn-dependent dehydrogenase